jgi:uncharacterized repeat protein (TIGR01451 family)/CSLREA domain-containing protein
MLLTRVANFKNAIVRLFLTFAAAMTLFLAAAPGAHAQATITVNSTAEEFPSVNNGNCTLREAIAAANTNAAVDGCAAGSVAGPDTIIVPAGTYTLTLVDNNSGGQGNNGLPAITSNIILQGAGAATTIIERSTAGGTPGFRFLFITGTNIGSVTLNDLTFRNGSPIQGGGVFIFGDGNDLKVNRCVFDNNTASGNGGAILALNTLNNTPLAITDSTFTNNTSSAGGGAIAGGLPNVKNSLFMNNGGTQSTGGPFPTCGGAGAIAIFTTAAGSSITDSTFLNNFACSGGGAIIAQNVSVTRSVFIGNHAGVLGTAFAHEAGAIWALGPSGGSITDSLFRNNTSLDQAGAVECNRCSITGSTFEGNTAGFQGGAVVAQSSGGAFSGGLPTITNSTFSGNRASDVGGAILAGSGSTYSNVTVTNNSAGNAGGGLVLTDNDFFRNSIIAGNTTTSGTGPDCFLNGTVTTQSQGHNILGLTMDCQITAATGDIFGFPQVSVDPILGSLLDNAGKTAGSNVGGQSPFVIRTHALLIGSPALDAGDPALPGSGGTACAAADQRGVQRPVGSACDIGAFEAPSGGVVPNVDVSITKSASPNPVAAGSNLTYTLTVRNSPTSTDNAPRVIATDVNPAGLIPVSVIPTNPLFTNCSIANTRTISCIFGTVAPGATETITIVVTVNAGTVSPISNTASVTTTGNDTDNTNDSATVLTTIGTASQADLSITKTGSPNPVNVNASLTYTINVTNNGPASAANVTMTDVLPAGVTFQSLTSTAGWTCTTPAVGANGTVTCTIASLANAAAGTFTLVVLPTASAAAITNNTATVSSATTDPTPGNNSASASTTVNVGADLSVTKTGAPNPVNVGSNLTYTITVTNNGPAAAASASLSDALPAGVNFVSLSPVAGWTCTTPAVGANGTVTCTNPSVASGASAVFTLVVTPSAAAAASISNTATVSSTTSDSNAANNSQTVTTTVNPVADVAITKTGTPNPVAVNSNITYTITVRNNGPSTATGVSVTDSVPANVNFVSATGSGTVACALAAGVITCNVGTLANGASITATVVVSTTALGTVTNTASVTSTTTDPSAANNSSTSTTNVSVSPSSDFSLALVPLLREIHVGETARYTATLTPLPANSSFNTAIAVTCFTNLPGAICNASPGFATPGTNPAVSDISVTLPKTSLVPGAPGRWQPPMFQPWVLWTLWVMLLAAVLQVLRSRKRWMQRGVTLAMLFIVLALLGGMTACSSALNPPVGPYVLTVTATSGSLSHSATSTINLRP